MKEANGDQMEMLHSPSDAQHWYAEHSWIGIDGIYIGEQIPIKEPLLRHQISYYQGFKKIGCSSENSTLENFNSNIKR